MSAARSSVEPVLSSSEDAAKEYLGSTELYLPSLHNIDNQNVTSSTAINLGINLYVKLNTTVVTLES